MPSKCVPARRGVRLSPDALFSLALCAVCVWAVWEGRNWPPQARLFPWVVGIPMAVLALVQAVLDLRGGERRMSGFESDITEGLEPAEARKRIALILGWIVGFYALIVFLGFPLAVPLGVFLYLKVGSRESWPLSILVTAGVVAVFFGLFIYVLNMPFPTGLLPALVIPSE